MACGLQTAESSCRVGTLIEFMTLAAELLIYMATTNNHLMYCLGFCDRKSTPIYAVVLERPLKQSSLQFTQANHSAAVESQLMTIRY
jgi:hypothetical protein